MLNTVPMYVYAFQCTTGSRTAMCAHYLRYIQLCLCVNVSLPFDTQRYVRTFSYMHVVLLKETVYVYPMIPYVYLPLSTINWLKKAYVQKVAIMTLVVNFPLERKKYFELGE